MRFYHLHLQQDLLGGWTLVRESGQQGKRGQVTKTYYESRDEAEAALTKFRDAQTRRGYRIVFREGEQAADNN
ncbi:MAG: WGR domain-containing protein [Chromatiales bacterium]|nr:WGR domain-containing protein [Chromatiales bacterium]